MGDINHEQYILNRDGFLQSAHIALLYRMLAIVGYKYPSAEFDQLRHEATRGQIVAQIQRYSLQMSESPWRSKGEPDTAIGARILREERREHSGWEIAEKESDEQ